MQCALQLITLFSRFVPYKEDKHPLWLNISRNCACNPYDKRYQPPSLPNTFHPLCIFIFSCQFIGAFANIGPLPGGRLVISGACLDPKDTR